VLQNVGNVEVYKYMNLKTSMSQQKINDICTIILSQLSFSYSHYVLFYPSIILIFVSIHTFVYKYMIVS